MCKCEICGNGENLVLGQNTLFDEFDFICEDCLSEMDANEFGLSYEEIAENNFKMLNLSEDDEYRITVEDNSVVVILYTGYGKIKTVLVECDSNDEAIDVLCAIC